MIYTIKTLSSLASIVEEMGNHAKSQGLDLLNHYQLKEILQNKGYPIEKEIHVFELCDPHTAQQVLSQVDAVSVYLPCRISAYEEKGFTRLSTPKIDTILNTSDVDEELKAFMSILFYNIKSLMHSWI